MAKWGSGRGWKYFWSPFNFRKSGCLTSCDFCVVNSFGVVLFFSMYNKNGKASPVCACPHGHEKRSNPLVVDSKGSEIQHSTHSAWWIGFSNT